MLVTMALMTVDEARTCADKIRRGMADVRQLMLEFHEREGWQALGYSSWRECAMTEFGYGQSHVYELLNAARVERNLSAIAEKPVKVIETHARPLAKLEPQAQHEVWTKAVATAPEGKVTAKHVEKAVVEWERNKNGKDNVTPNLSDLEPEDENTITIRAFELGFFMAMGKRYTAAQVAQEFELSPSGAYRLLSRASGSKRIPLFPDEGVWMISAIEAKEWPY